MKVIGPLPPLLFIESISPDFSLARNAPLPRVCVTDSLADALVS